MLCYNNICAMISNPLGCPPIRASIATSHFLASVPSISRPQSQQQPRPLPSFLPTLAPTGQIRDVRIPRQRLRNLPARLNPSNHNQAVPRPRHGPRNRLCALGLPLRPDHIRLPFLLRLLDDEAAPFGILLRDLLLLDGAGEFFAEGHVRDGDVFEGDVEFRGALQQVGPDARGDGLPLRD